MSNESLEQIAAQALRQERPIFLLSALVLTEQSLHAPAFRYGPIRAFSLQDDRGSSDDCLCVIFQMADQWYIAYQGHRSVFTQLIGTTTAVHTAHVWEQLRLLWAGVIAAEGALRRQD